MIRNLRALLLCGLCWPVWALAQTNAAPLQAIPNLDLQRYVGRWYEIARYPNRFQRRCVANTSAEYTANADGTVRVLNSCQTASGELIKAEGLARRVGAADSATLEVRFAPAWLSFIPAVWGDYWVIDLDSEYQLAAVSEPGRDYLWILSRTPTVAPERYAGLLERLKQFGLDPARLVLTAQN
jgi:apolipoprotein D and lipocalin family protein